ncbi:MAG: hypothetical protein PHQ14_05530 [Chromatiales bacterium]|jgi:hypothetical protein|nr:hypothetical protein [Chromatiales bacterium]MDX9766269.1 hypothetical protein [Ectothiorhodospiraceae bacterium]
MRITERIDPRLLALIGIVLLAALSRLLPHPPNVTPIAAMALFAGAAFADRRLAFGVPLAAMLLSDLLLGLHATLAFVYAGFVLTVLIGMRLHERRTVMRVGVAAFAASVLFFLITNFGSWLAHGMYPRTGEGLLMAYTAGLPFFRNSLFGDLFFTALIFGGFYLIERRFPSLQSRAA